MRLGHEEATGALILPLVRQAHKESYFADRPFDREAYERIASNVLKDPGFNGGLHVEYDGEPVAFAYYMLRPLLGSKTTWVTVMHSVYIRSDIRSTALGGYIWNRIITMARTWSAPRGSKGMIFNVISGVAVQESDILIRAAGGTYLGGNYFVRV